MKLQAQDRRHQILQAATEVFAESNYRAAGIASIAKRAGVSEALIYRHFQSKKALFVEILDRIGQAIVAVWESETIPKEGAIVALERAGRTYLKNLDRHPAEAAVQFQALAETSDPEIAAILRTNHELYLSFFEQLVKRGQMDGTIRNDIDPRIAALILNASGFSFTLNEQLGLIAESGANRDIMNAQLIWLAKTDGH